ncbi:DUF4307 domain-containing protein [Amycolatopsis acidiphila]|uniref:DUF4307 domain-containing protein n=1 Tax=Amycolatopsis acidiphila TaxID=715473 RepID=UPI0019CB9D90|nr:DUF4307 domain-containing protein [Amycolatopsis acidiphila]UIJ58969.1 DUF4307 domain-containing protein [Amycolatopsis acidiphila]GHG73073.1 hypothetical protein GCM10017788_36130 [Amycolatopsis acidiphila]
MTTRALPEGRYGSPSGRTPARWRRWAFTAVALLVSAAVAWIAYVNLGPAPIDADRVSFSQQPGNAMSVTINVTRDDPSKPGVCIVRLRDISGAESGRKEVYVPAGDNHSRQTTVVRSIDPPVDADVFGCSYDVPTYLSSS